MDDKFKKVITVVVLIILAIIALKIIGVVIRVLFPLAVICGIGFLIFKLINKNSAKKY